MSIYEINSPDKFDEVEGFSGHTMVPHDKAIVEFGAKSSAIILILI